ncbi:MAG: hypothetical protein KDJ36_14160, partial [Hyphomicrobiaceae bacterium]|nr:hypothetical protein [Hyphomicrobiaceae bacterium]
QATASHVDNAHGLLNRLGLFRRKAPDSNESSESDNIVNGDGNAAGQQRAGGSSHSQQATVRGRAVGGTPPGRFDRS